METVVCRLQEHTVSFSFCDGHREDIEKYEVQQSSLIREVLSEGHEQQVVTLAAPRSYLRTWCHLRTLISEAGTLDGISLNELANLFMIADYFADYSAMGKVLVGLSRRLFKTETVERSARTQEQIKPCLAHGASKTLRCLHEDLVTSVLRAAVNHRRVNLNDLIRLLPRSLVASAVRSHFLEGTGSRTLEIDCLKHDTSTSSAILSNLSQFPQAREVHIITMACSRFRSRANSRHCSSLSAALEHAVLHNMSVSLCLVVHCSFSLEHLLQRVAPVCGAVRTLELSDGRVGRANPFSKDRLGRLSFHAVRHLQKFTGLQHLSLQNFLFASTNAEICCAPVQEVQHLTCLTKLTMNRCVRGHVLHSILSHVPQLRSLDACCVVKDSQELVDLQGSLCSLTHLTSLTMSECAWSKAVRALLFCTRWPLQVHQVTDLFREEYIRAIKEVQSNRPMTDCYRCLLGSFPLGNLTVPSGSPLQVLDLSKCCMNDDMIARFVPDLQRLSALQAVGFGVCKPGPNTLRALEALQTCTALTSLTLTADRAALITEDFERHLCVLKTLRALNLSNCTTCEAIQNRPPLLTALTGLTELILENCVPSLVTHEQFLKGMGHLTALVTLSLCHVPVPTVAAANSCAGAFYQLQALKRLKLANLDVSEEAASNLGVGLGFLTSLTHLSLEAPFAAHLPLLHVLCLAMHDMTTLKELQVSRMVLNAHCSGSLAQAIRCPALSGLQRLQLKHCNLSRGAYYAFRSGFAAHPCHTFEQYHLHQGLRDLDWSFNTMDNYDVWLFSKIISLFPRIKTCTLQGQNLARMGWFRPIQHRQRRTCRERDRFESTVRVSPIYMALVRLQDLQFIDLRHNDVWPDSAMEILAGLGRSCRQLRDLDPGTLMKLEKNQNLGLKRLCGVATSDDPFKCDHLRDVGVKYLRILRRVRWRTGMFIIAGVGLLLQASMRRSRKLQLQQQAQIQERIRAERESSGVVRTFLTGCVSLAMAAGMVERARHS